MGKETTPKTISDNINVFCNSISPNSILEYINVLPGDGCTHDDCFHNVLRRVEISGGTMQLGWMIWIRPNILLNAAAHAIWVSETDEKLDITPKYEDKILFLHDDTLAFSGYRIGSKYKALTASPLVEEFIRLLEKQSEIISQTATTQVHLSYPLGLSERLNEINLTFNRKAGRNEQCPCQSGLKYKKCCG